MNATGELEKAAQTYQELSDNYPRLGTANDSGWTTSYEEVLEV